MSAFEYLQNIFDVRIFNFQNIESKYLKIVIFSYLVVGICF